MQDLLSRFWLTNKIGDDFGELGERLIPLAWKASVPQGTTGSNPVLAAILGFGSIRPSSYCSLIALICFENFTSIYDNGASDVWGICPVRG